MSAVNKSLLTEKLDFEHWSSLASRDPQEFERSREQIIDELIAAAPADAQHRLRGLQWRIDRTRERSATPLGSCVAVSRMMWDTYERLNQVLTQLTQPGSQAHPASPAAAKVLAFPVKTEAEETAPVSL